MMKHTATYRLLMAGAVLVGMATSCTNDDITRMWSGDDGRITFEATTEQAATTRGMAEDLTPVSFEGTQPKRPLVLSATVTDSPSGTMTRGVRFGDSNTDVIASFGVSAIKAPQNADDEALAALKADFFHNLEATRTVDTGPYHITQDYYWPASNEKLHFYAYTPYNGTGIDVWEATDVQTGPQKLTFTVNSTVTSQTDLMTAYAGTQGFSSVTGDAKKASVPLTFTHELTAIRFVIGEQWLAGSIKSVAIKNVHGKGTLTIGSHQWTWKDKNANDLAATDNFTLTLDKTGIEGTNNEEFMDGDFAGQYFLMIPQEFDANSTAYLEVKYQDQAKEYTVTAPLANTAWTRNKTITYAISSTALTTLKIGTIAWPDETAADAWDGPKKAFAGPTDVTAGDSIGLYVVDTDGTTILHQNVKCTYDGAAWTIHHPANNPVYKLPGRQYFFYYPYTPTPDTKYPLQGQGNTETEATAFFSHLIDGWDPAAIQNTIDKLKKQDLQVGKGVDHATLASTVNAQMAHQMNIGVLTLTSKNVNTEVYYKLDDSYQWKHSGDITSVPASANFSGNLPYTHTDDKHYFVFKPVTDPQSQPGTQMMALNSVNTADWSLYLQKTARGVKQAETVTTQLSSTNHTDTYTLTIGDIYYSNGTISHDLITNNENYGTPVGIVFATSTSTTDTNDGYIHGYVVAAKNAAESVQWSTLENNDVGSITNLTWSSTATSADIEPTIMNLNINGQNGRTNTEAIGFTNTNYPAFVAIGAFNNSASKVTRSGVSSWYMPSIAELHLLAVNLGNMSISLLSSQDKNSWGSGGVVAGCAYNATTTVRTALNTALAKTGTGNYDNIVGTNGTVGYYWASSESFPNRAFTMNLGTYIDFDIIEIKNLKEHIVRPILAF